MEATTSQQRSAPTGTTPPPGSSTRPRKRSPHCPKCGLATFTKCPECNSNVRGDYYTPDAFLVVVGSSSWTLDSFCCNCGQPFPWTEQKIAAAQELVNELGLDEADRQSLEQAIPDLSSDSPKTELAVSRYSRIRSKVTGVAASALDKAVGAIATAAAKQLLGL